jgi:hypothetical protein
MQDISYTYNWSSENVSLRLIELPEFPEIIDNETFVTDIIESVKIQCITTDIPDNYSSQVVLVVSKFLLPVGPWSLLEQMLGNPNPTHTSCMTSDSCDFEIDYYSGTYSESDFLLTSERLVNLFPNCGRVTTHGWISLETGVPYTC